MKTGLNPSAVTLRQKAEEMLVWNPEEAILPETKAQMLTQLREIELLKLELELQARELNGDNSVDTSGNDAAGEKMNTEEDRWKYALEGATDGMWDWDITTQSIFFSKQWKAMLGFADDEIGNSLEEWSKRVHPEDLAGALSDINSHLNGETEAYSNKHRMICKDGSQKWILDEGRVIKRDKHGQALRAIGTHKDITHQIVLEHDLQERMKELSIHNHLSELMINPALSQDEVIGKIVEFIPNGWQFPEMTQAKVQVYDTVFETPGYTGSEHKISNEIKVGNKIVGKIDVCYMVQEISDTSDLFLPEEHNLLFSIAERLGNFIEKVEKERALNRSEEKYRDLVENISDAIYKIDNTGCITFISPSIEKIIGYTAEEVTGKNFIDFVGVNSEFLQQRFKELTLKNELSKDYQLVTKAGTPCWVRLSTKAILENGSLSGAYGTLIDITDNKLVELELEKSEALYRSILNASPDVITITNLEGKILLVSPQAIDMFGYPDTECLKDKSLFEFIEQNGHDKARDAIMQMFQNKFTGATEYLGIKSDRTTIDIEVNGDFIRDKEGVPSRMIFIVRDISDRKTAEEKLRKSEEQYRNLVETISDTIYEIDTQGVIRYISPAIEKMTGYSPQEVIGKNTLNFVHPDDVPFVINALSNLEGTNITYEEFRFITKSGETCWVRSSTTPAYDKGILTGGTGSLNNITLRKNAEDALRESEKKFELIIHSQAEGIGVMNTNEVFEFVNPAAAKLFDTTIAELIGTSLYDFLVPDEIARINELSGNRKKGIAEKYELQIVTKCGNVKYLDVSATPKTDENGVFEGTFGVFYDVTKRKMVENALLDSQEKFSKAFLTAPYAITITSADNGKFLEINDSFCSYSGYTKEEAYADSSIGLKLWANIEDRNNVIADLSQGKEVVAREYDFISKDGKIRNCIFSASLLALNNKPYILSSITDISEIKQTQDQLRKLSSAVVQSPVSILITNLDGEIEYANPKAYETTGYSPGELIGKNPSIIKSGETAQSEYKQLWNEISAGKEWQGQFHNKRKNGELYWESANISAITGADGKITHYLAIKEDITERKKTEEALLKSEQELNFAQEIAGMSSWELNMITDKLQWSKNYYQIMGKPVGSDVKSDFFLNRVHPDDVRLVDENLEKLKHTRKPVTYDIRIRMADDAYKWIQNNIAPEFEGEKLVRLKGVNIDIDAKKKAEEKNLLQNERLNAIISTLPDLLFVIDKEGIYQEVYYSNAESLLISADQIVGSSIKTIFSTELAAIHHQKIVECITTKKLITYEYATKIGGNSDYFEARLAPFNEDRVLALVRDISEKKKKENDILKLSLAVEQSPVSIAITDLDANIEYVNPVFLKTTGYSKEELLGKNPRILKSGETDKAVYEKMYQTLNEGNQWFGEWTNQRKNGELYWETVSITPVTDESGKITNYLEVKQDITQRKKAEQEIIDLNINLELKIKERTLKLAETNANLVSEMEQRIRISAALAESEKSYRTVVENISEIIFQTDTDGLWLFLNKTWENVTGFTVSESIGKQLLDFVHPNDRELNAEFMKPLIAGEKEFCTHQIRFITKDGGFRWVEVFARLGFDDDKNATGTYGTIQDITDRKRNEEFENELLQLSIQLTGVPGSEIGPAINSSLNRVGRFLQSDRAYIFEINPSNNTMTNTYEWCNDGISPEIENLRDIPTSLFPMWMEKLKRYENIIIPSVKDLPETWISEREILEPQGIKSLIVSPIFKGLDLIGFIGLDSVVKQREFDDSEINILIVWSSMLASLINTHRNELILDQTRNNYETFFNTIDDFLFVLDNSGNILHTNNSVSRRLGYTQDELLEKSVLMVHPVERRAEAGRIVGEMLAGTADFCPVPLLTKSSVQIPVETRVKPGFWNGKPVIFGVSKDVSKIRLSEEKFSRAFQSNAALMAISGLEDELFMDVNQTFLNTLGYTYAEVIGKTSAELGFFEYLNDRKAAIERLKQNQSVREIEILVRTKSGTQLVGLFSADIIYIGDKKCLLTVMIDITASKKALEEVKNARDEADKANMAKSEFLSRMSHELRTPMNSILGFAQLMEMGDLIPAHRRGVGHILKNGKHLLDLINEVLDISRIEAGRISLSIEPVKLNYIIQEVLDIVFHQASNRNQVITLTESPSNQLFVNADNQRLKQVLLNLVDNSLKYSKQGDTIKISTELLPPNSKGKSYIRISIIDKGIGIADDNLPKVFLPFERIGAEKTETEGTGLGLSVVKKLMEAMGGRVGAESTYGAGSTFWIELESAENLKHMDDYFSVSEISGNEEPLKKATVLYFEDNISNIELVDGIIGNHRPAIQLETAINGKNAVKKALDCKPDLILLDLDLPEIHGSEVLAQLLAEPQTSSIPVVIISADAMSHQIKKMLKSGARDYLTKPIQISTFLQMIDLWTGINKQ